MGEFAEERGVEAVAKAEGEDSSGKSIVGVLVIIEGGKVATRRNHHGLAVRQEQHSAIARLG